MTRDHIRIGTRGSALARAQTEAVVALLRRAEPHIAIEVAIVKTTGDAIVDRPFSAIGGKGLFTREIEDALLAERIDLAVHSLKDLPTELPAGLALGATAAREDPREALVGATRAQLSEGGLSVGTGSLRRRAQVLRAFPGVEVVDIRGNVDTRIEKVRKGRVDCALLALAGLRRLGRESEASEILDTDEMMPAPAQGAVAVEVREDDPDVRDLLRGIHCERTARCVAAERTFLARLGGGCRVPVAACARIEGDLLHLEGRVISLDGGTMVEDSHSGWADSPSPVGEELADAVLAKGADRILEKVRDG